MFMILLTSLSAAERSGGVHLRLTASVEAQAIVDGEVHKLRHIILLQVCTSQQSDGDEVAPELGGVLSSEEAISSPAARNVMIRHVLDDEAIAPSTIVGFPDDDAWYPRGSLACVARHLGDPHLQLLVSRYGPSPSADQCGHAFRPTLQQALARGACAAIFVRGTLLAQLGGFHPLLGLGPSLAAAKTPSSCTAPFIVRASKSLHTGVPRRSCSG